MDLFDEESNQNDNDFEPITEDSPKFVSYGGGVNSTAMLVLLKSQQIRPDYILFADTGGEQPHTYTYLELVDQWLKSIDFPAITTVRYKGTDRYQTLEEDCLANKALPSKAYGYGKCSAKYKVQPQQEFIKQIRALKLEAATIPYVLDPQTSNFYKSLFSSLTQRYLNFVGIHAGETKRLIGKNGKLKTVETKDYLTRYPLIENNIYQNHCIALIQAVGLPVPKKSSCFFCPSMRPTEILQLKQDYPDLYERALAIEKAGMETAHTLKGLGRKFSWADVGKLTEIEQAILDAEKRQCGCVDEF